LSSSFLLQEMVVKIAIEASNINFEKLLFFFMDEFIYIKVQKL
jgi:hypothetical protein